MPGPAAVTYRENIAYRATFTNTGSSTFTHVVFRMRVPFVSASGSQPYVEATPVEDTCPSTPVVVGTTNGPEWTCDFGQLAPGTAGTPQVVLTTVWQVPTLTSAEDCENCLQTNGRWTIKEGVNDNTDPNDAFPPGGIAALATLLSAESSTLDSSNTTSAGGYEVDACTNALGPGSLRTKQTLAAGENPVSTTICIPTIPTDASDLGLATTIVEGVSQSGNPGHAALGRSDVCVAALGENCPAGEPQDFGTANPLVLVFRIADAALDKGDKITQVWHNGVELPSCGDEPTNENGCVVSIDLSKGKVKIWTIVVRSATNGFYNW